MKIKKNFKWIIILLIIVVIGIILYFIIKNHNKQKFDFVIKNKDDIDNQLDYDSLNQKDDISNSNAIVEQDKLSLSRHIPIPKKFLRTTYFSADLDDSIKKQRLDQSILSKFLYISDLNIFDIKNYTPIQQNGIQPSIFKNTIFVNDPESDVGEQKEIPTLDYMNNYVVWRPFSYDTPNPIQNKNIKDILMGIDQESVGIETTVVEYNKTLQDIFAIPELTSDLILNLPDNEYSSYNIGRNKTSSLIQIEAELFKEENINPQFLIELSQLTKDFSIQNTFDNPNDTDKTERNYIERNINSTDTDKPNNIHIEDSAWEPYRNFLKKWGSHVLVTAIYGKNFNIWETYLKSKNIGNSSTSADALNIRKCILATSLTSNDFTNCGSPQQITDTQSIITKQSVYFNGNVSNITTTDGTLLKFDSQKMNEMFSVSDDTDPVIDYVPIPLWEAINRIYSLQCKNYIIGQYVYTIQQLIYNCTALVTNYTDYVTKYQNKLIPDIQTQVICSTHIRNLQNNQLSLSFLDIQNFLNITQPLNTTMNIDNLLFHKVNLIGNLTNNTFQPNGFDITNFIYEIITDQNFINFYNFNATYKYILVLSSYNDIIKTYNINTDVTTPVNINSYLYAIDKNNNIVESFTYIGNLKFVITNGKLLINMIDSKINFLYQTNFYDATLSGTIELASSNIVFRNKISLLDTKKVFILKEDNNLIFLEKNSINKVIDINTLKSMITINGYKIKFDLTYLSPSISLTINIGNQILNSFTLQKSQPCQYDVINILDMSYNTQSRNFNTYLGHKLMLNFNKILSNNDIQNPVLTYTNTSGQDDIIFQPINCSYDLQNKKLVFNYNVESPGGRVVVQDSATLTDVEFNVVLQTNSVDPKFLWKFVTNRSKFIRKNNDNYVFDVTNQILNGVMSSRINLFPNVELEVNNTLTSATIVSDCIKTNRPYSIYSITINLPSSIDFHINLNAKPSGGFNKITNSITNFKLDNTALYCKNKFINEIVFINELDSLPPSNDYNYEKNITIPSQSFNKGDNINITGDSEFNIKNFTLEFSLNETFDSTFLNVGKYIIPMPLWFDCVAGGADTTRFQKTFYINNKTPQSTESNQFIFDFNKIKNYFQNVSNVDIKVFSYNNNPNPASYCSDFTKTYSIVADPSEQRLKAFGKKVQIIEGPLSLPNLPNNNTTQPPEDYYNIAYVDESDIDNIKNIIELYVPKKCIEDSYDPCLMLQAAFNLETAYITQNKTFCPYIQSQDPNYPTLQKIISKNVTTNLGSNVKSYGCWAPSTGCQSNSDCTGNTVDEDVLDSSACTYGRGAGRIPGSRGRGVGRIPDVNCNGKCGGNKQGIGAAAWCDNGPTWPWDLRTCSANITCHDDEEMNGGLCYPKCKSTEQSIGCCICRENCNDDEQEIDGLCYPKCKPGYYNQGCCICKTDSSDCKVSRSNLILCEQKKGIFHELTPSPIIYNQDKKEYSRSLATIPPGVPSSGSDLSSENAQYSCAASNARINNFGLGIRSGGKTGTQPCECQNPYTIKGKSDVPYTTSNLYRDRLIWDQLN